MSEFQPSAELEALRKTFSRDINRTNDSDRNTRKRGLQKLLEDLPWQRVKGSNMSALADLLVLDAFGRLLVRNFIS